MLCNKTFLANLEYLFYNLKMNALDTLIELSSQMELEHAEESRSPAVGRVAPSVNEERIETTPACFTPKARPEFNEREKEPRSFIRRNSPTANKSIY